MSLRPRYSLLTLLVLTALVVGGVKLWYGPHQVVERPSSENEFEYTYTRDWRGKKTTHGPFIVRSRNPDGTLSGINVIFYRNHINTNWQMLIEIDSSLKTFSQRILTEFVFGDLMELLPQEKLEFDAAIRKEHERLQNAGYQMIPKDRGN